MFEWIETRYIITAVSIIVVVILLDELAYHTWKKANPGSLYSHLNNRTLPPLDPSRPPTTIYYG